MGVFLFFSFLVQRVVLLLKISFSSFFVTESIWLEHFLCWDESTIWNTGKKKFYIYFFGVFVVIATINE